MKPSLLLKALLTSLALLSAGLRLGAAATPPLFDGLGSHTWKITTTSPDAQKYFDQGLRFYFGFNHGAAIRSFKESARLDPQCAMAHWGIALANGPHINFPLVPPPAAEEAWSELVLARQNAGRTTAVEQALIEALGKRYANPQPDDRSPLDKGYADAMREVWKKFPKDADVGVLFAEAMMDLRPWDQWTPEGQPQPGTNEILATLDAVLAMDINHPFANHLYIHAVEASPHPERALAAADRLRDLQPALAHNVHMPSHIDIRVGHWHEAVAANVKAVEAAAHMRAVVGPPSGILVFYNAHNHQMLTWAAMMTGQSKLALNHVHTMVAEIPTDTWKEFAGISEGMGAMPYEVLVRFGRWEEMIAEPEVPDWMPLTRALRHAGRGIAFAAKEDPRSARSEQAAYLEAIKKVPADEMMLNNPAAAIVAIATPMLDGEILVREGKVDEGLTKLREAVKAEDALHYDEPPGWVLPVRHSLGATLMKFGRYAEAERVYRDDLARLPENGWSLFGLAQSLAAQRKNAAEATELEARLKTIWTKADLKLTSSCLCQPGM
jgi:tetratricopeptide (TPR) repeat protein